MIGFCIYGDGIGYYAPLRSALFDGDLAVRNEYEHYATMQSSFGGGARWRHAIPEYSKYTVGMALVLFPFVMLGHGITLLLNTLRISTVPANSLTWPYNLFYGFGSLMIGILGLFYTYQGLPSFCR